MANPELTNEPVRIRRRSKSGWERSGSRRERGAWDYNNSTSWYVDVTKIVNRRIEIPTLEHRFVLLIDVIAPGSAKTPPASRINLYTCESIDRAVLKRVRRPRSNVLGGAQLQNRLNVLIHREVETYTGNNLIRSIQQHEL